MQVRRIISAVGFPITIGNAIAKTYNFIIGQFIVNVTETWEFIYGNKDNQLKSSMYANALLRLGRKESSFVVPSKAVATNLEKRFVIRIKDGKTERRNG